MNQVARELIRRIDERTAEVGVVGLGYAGLPLALEFARAGLRVTGIDIDAQKIAALREGRSYIPDIPADQIRPLVEEGKFQPTTDYDRVRDLDAISICVPTPLSKTKDPDLSYIVSVVGSLKDRVSPGSLVVLESTTYPGTTREVVLLAMGDRLRVGEDFFLAFSPERVDPGNPHFAVRNTPKIVGGITPVCTEVAVALYGQVVEQIIPVSSAETAEMAKLLENTFRAVNIGLVNEVAIMCHRLGIDTWEVIEAAATKPFGFMKFTPGPGLGGHCIPVDPHYLSWKMRTLDYHPRFIALADEVNAQMPAYTVSRLTDVLNTQRRSVNGSIIAVIGVAYKRDVNDVRESPALDIINLLQARGAQVRYHDPYVPSIQLATVELESLPLDAALDGAHLTVITTHHSNIDYREVYERSAAILDTRNAFAGWDDPDGKITRL